MRRIRSQLVTLFTEYAKKAAHTVSLLSHILSYEKISFDPLKTCNRKHLFSDQSQNITFLFLPKKPRISDTKKSSRSCMSPSHIRFQCIKKNSATKISFLGPFKDAAPENFNKCGSNFLTYAAPYLSVLI
jgi:hypothetical protein